MGKYVLAIVLLAGCAETSAATRDDVQRSIQQVRAGVTVAGQLAKVLCDLHKDTPAVCSTLRGSWVDVDIALEAVEELYAQTVAADGSLRGGEVAQPASPAPVGPSPADPPRESVPAGQAP